MVLEEHRNQLVKLNSFIEKENIPFDKKEESMPLDRKKEIFLADNL